MSSRRVTVATLVICGMAVTWTSGCSDDGTAGAGGASGSSGTTATGGASGSSGAAGGGSCHCGPLEECWNGRLCVAKLVAMPGGYSIDATEVTRSQYDAWLQSNPSATGQVAECQTWKTTYAPSCGWPPGERGRHPVVCVDWCDAHAYCKGVGKRLCGKIGGGANAYGDAANADASQWYAACSSGGKNTYPYGGAYQPQTCNGVDNDSTGCSANSSCTGPCACTTVEVGTLQGCQASESEYAGVYDLSGNVYEWEDACSGSNGQYDLCHLRGGTYTSDDYLACGTGGSLGRFNRFEDFGFRCCAP